MNKRNRRIVFGLIAIYIAIRLLIREMETSILNDKSAEETNVKIYAMEISNQPEIIIEPQITPEPTEKDLDAIINYEQEVVGNIIAQGMNYNDFYTLNQATVGFLAVKGTNIYYPVCSSDTDEKWLGTLFNGNSSGYGTIYLDYPANEDLSSKISTLFGHNMRDGRMFSPLNKYINDPNYYKDHDYAFVSTKDYIKVYKFASASRILESEGKEFRTANFSTEEDFLAYLELLSPRIVSKDDSVNMKEADYLLQLATCTGRGHSKRTSVHFVYQYQIPNILNTEQTTEQIQTDINNTVRAKNNFSKMVKNVLSYEISTNANYIVIQGLNDSLYIWTKDSLPENERTAFLEMYGLNVYKNHMFINGHNMFDIDGKKVALEPSNNSTTIYCEEGSLKMIKEGNFSFKIKTEKVPELKLTDNK